MRLPLPYSVFVKWSRKNLILKKSYHFQKRRILEKDSKFKRIYTEQKARVAKMNIKAVAIEDSETEAVFEIYASKKLRTRYNEFNTH